MSVSGPIP
jgi:hypothetical protein